MFEHSFSRKCLYEDRCTQKLCAFQHEKLVDSDHEQVENMDGKASEMFSDNVVKTVDKSTDEDEESFQTYVKVNFEDLFKKFKEKKNN